MSLPDVRVRVDLAYDGTDFSGWAVQPGLRTVQGDLEDALSTVLRSPGLSTVVAGRTDAGVHARGQVCHVDVPAAALAANRGRSSASPEEVLRRRLSGVLGPDVLVSAVTRAPEGFEARFSALRRRYTYRYCDDPAGVPPLLRREVVPVRSELDVVAMRAAAAGLLGLHDFAAFCRRREGATTVRTLLRLDWERRDGLVVATVEADAFCHSMVRALVGACAGVGLGHQPLDWPSRVLLAGRRDGAVQVARAHGLVLEEVVYPDDALLAARARESRARRDALPAG